MFDKKGKRILGEKTSTAATELGKTRSSPVETATTARPSI